MGFNKEEDKKSLNLEESLSKTLGLLQKIQLHDLKLSDSEQKHFSALIKQYEVALKLERRKS